MKKRFYSRKYRVRATLSESEIVVVGLLSRLAVFAGMVALVDRRRFSLVRGALMEGVRDVSDR